MARAKDKRLFARLDLDYADHPKIVALSDAAFRAHVEMILYARKYMTDGVIPKRVANRFGTESLSELLANDEKAPSLIDLGDGDYLLHGYADMNETKSEVEHRTRVNIENGRRGGLAKKRSAKRAATGSVSESGSENGSENVAETETETETDITPLNPPEGGAKKGTRLQEGWMPTGEDVSVIAEQCPGFNSEREHLNFMDYWLSKPGRAGVKIDWSRTWRTWMRNAYDRLPASQKPTRDRKVKRF